jgi:hypothetical protein
METVRTHRVGSITTGISLIVFGGMFLLHLFSNTITYSMIFKLWPIILIGLGIEVLLSNYAKEKIVYDKAAIALMFVIAIFAMGMASADWIFTNIQGII